MFAIEAQSLTRMHGSRRVLDRLDLALSAGETMAVLGANGVGKTTLLRCLAGCLRPAAGQVLWFSKSAKGDPAARRLVGFAGHESLVYPELSAHDNLLFAARMAGREEPAKDAARMLDKIGIARTASQPAGQLSKGQRQRLSLARALIHDPPIVILDEPFTGLDSQGRTWLEDWLAELHAQGSSVIFTGHDQQQCQRIAGRCFELSGHGRGTVPIREPRSPARGTSRGALDIGQPVTV